MVNCAVQQKLLIVPQHNESRQPIQKNTRLSQGCMVVRREFLIFTRLFNDGCTNISMLFNSITGVYRYKVPVHMSNRGGPGGFPREFFF